MEKKLEHNIHPYLNGKKSVSLLCLYIVFGHKAEKEPNLRSKATLEKQKDRGVTTHRLLRRTFSGDGDRRARRHQHPSAATPSRTVRDVIATRPRSPR